MTTRTIIAIASSSVLYLALPVTAQETAAGTKPLGHSESEQRIDFRSHYLATPLLIPGDPKRQAITSLRIRCRQLATEGGRAQVTFDLTDLDFNDFGDATEVGPKHHFTHDATLKPLKVNSRFLSGRSLYLLQFSDGLWTNRLYLVWALNPEVSSRLLVVAGNDPLPLLNTRASHWLGGGSDFHQILELDDGQRITHDAPLPQELSLQTDRFERNTRSYRSIELMKREHGESSLTNDWRQIGFSPFGDAMSATMQYISPLPATFVERKIEDPSKQGRRLFDVVLKKTTEELDSSKEEFSFVLAPTIAGPHRLIIRKAGNVENVQPLYNYQWRRYLGDRANLRGTSTDEQRAIARIRELIGRGLDFETYDPHTLNLQIRDRTITSLSFTGEDGNDDTLRQLVHLPNLGRLDLIDCVSISSKGFSPIGRLAGLRVLRFYGTPIPDSVLRQVANLRNLRTLDIFHKTADGLPPKAVPHLTDDGAPAIATLKQLTYLRISHVTDRSLSSIASLTALRELALCGKGFTSLGLIHVRRLKNLRRLEFIQTSIQPSAGIQLIRSMPPTKRARSFSLNSTGEDGQTDFQFTYSSKDAEATITGKVNVATLGQVAAIVGLKDLRIADCHEIADDALSQLHDVSTLKLLRLHGTKVSERALAALRENLPDCHIDE